MHSTTSALTLFAALALSTSGCGSTPSAERVSYAMTAEIEGGAATTADGWTVELTRADLAFGPIYFCAASFGSSGLCESAVGESLGDVLVSAVSSTTRPLGTVHGLTGPVRSASFDLGIHWFPTQTAPTKAPGVEHSLVVEGMLVRDTRRIPFRLTLDAVPQFSGQRFAPTREAVGNVTSETSELVVHFPVRTWLAALPADAIVSASGGAPIVVEPRTPASDAVLLDLQVVHPVTFEWRESP